MVEMDSTSEFPDEATNSEHARKIERARHEAISRFPLVTRQTAARRLGCTQPALTRRANKGQLISVRWKEARRFPDFQFDPRHRRLRPYLERILEHFTAQEREEGWPVYLWFATPQKSMHDEYPANILLRDPARVLQAIQGEGAPRDW
jgi:hypothetical protein